MDENLRKWFKEEDWVRIDTQGNIAGSCGSNKKGKKTQRCLPRKKAQSLSKAERKATARKKTASKKQFVKNTKKAKVSLKKENMDLKSIILKTLEKEGGAAGLKALTKATKTSKKDLEQKLAKMGGVKQHQDGDYISTPLTEASKQIFEMLTEKLCKKGKAYVARRKAAGEKHGAYLMGRAVKVCKGQMSGKKKKKNEELKEIEETGCRYCTFVYNPDGSIISDENGVRLLDCWFDDCNASVVPGTWLDDDEEVKDTKVMKGGFKSNKTRKTNETEVPHRKSGYMGYSEPVKENNTTLYELKNIIRQVLEEKKKGKCKPSKGKRFAKRVNGKCRSFGQAGKAKKGGDRIRPGTAKAHAYCARSAKIKKCKNPPCANALSRKKWKCQGSRSVTEATWTD